MSLPEVLLALLKSQRINSAAVTAIVATARLSLSLNAKREEDESRIPIGATKIGGSPDLPHGTAWPKAQGVNFRFLAQINLADAALMQPCSLPDRGLLSFFWCQEDTLGMTAEGGRVMYTHQNASLIRVPDPWMSLPDRVGLLGRLFGKKPSPRGRGFWPCAVETAIKLTLPDPFGPRAVPKEILTDAEFDEVYGGGLEKELIAAGVLLEGHRLLGEASAIQDAVENEAEAESRHNAVAGSGVTDKAAAAWRLLLQIDSDDAPGFCFGDWGAVYFMMREVDLAAHRWERARVVVQCH